VKEVFNTICLIAVAQVIFLFIALFIKRKNRIANRFLAMALFFIGLDMFELYLSSKGIITAYPQYYLFIIPYSYVIGISVYLFVSFLIGRIEKLSPKLLFYFVPFFIVLIYNITIYYFFGIKGNQTPDVIIFSNTVIFGSGLIFEAVLYLLSFILLQQYAGRLKEYFSSLAHLTLNFIKTTLIVCLIIDIVVFIPFVKGGHARYDYEIMNIITIFGVLGIVFVFAFFAITHPKIFNGIKLTNNYQLDSKSDDLQKYERSRLSESEAKKHVEVLLNYMIQEKPYLKDDFTLQDLAIALALSSHHLSMILNIHLKQNFYSFVNNYRIEEVKRMFGDPDNKDEKIITIAFNAGFNSKSTFNTSFKKITQKTPHEYRTELLS